MATHETQQRTAIDYNAHARFCSKMAGCTYGFQKSSAGSLQRSCFRQTDTPEMRFDLTDRHTDTQTKQTNYCNPPAHVHQGLMKHAGDTFKYHQTFSQYFLVFLGSCRGKWMHCLLTKGPCFNNTLFSSA